MIWLWNQPVTLGARVLNMKISEENSVYTGSILLPCIDIFYITPLSWFYLGYCCSIVKCANGTVVFLSPFVGMLRLFQIDKPTFYRSDNFIKKLMFNDLCSVAPCNWTLLSHLFVTVILYSDQWNVSISVSYTRRFRESIFPIILVYNQYFSIPT